MGDTTVTVREDAPAAQEIAVLQGTDPENHPLSYAVTSGNELGYFNLSADGRLTVSAAGAAALNHEEQAEYVLEVRVEDNQTPSLTSTATLTIQVTDVDEAPVFVPGPADANAQGVATSDEDAVWTYFIEVDDLDLDDTINIVLQAPGTADWLTIGPDPSDPTNTNLAVLTARPTNTTSGVPTGDPDSHGWAGLDDTQPSTSSWPIPMTSPICY